MRVCSTIGSIHQQSLSAKKNIKFRSAVDVLIQAASSVRGDLEVKGLSDIMAICKSSPVMSENHRGQEAEASVWREHR